MDAFNPRTTSRRAKKSGIGIGIYRISLPRRRTPLRNPVIRLLARSYEKLEMVDAGGVFRAATYHKLEDAIWRGKIPQILKP